MQVENFIPFFLATAMTIIFVYISWIHVVFYIDIARPQNNYL
jgi:hypothetical protein